MNDCGSGLRTGHGFATDLGTAYSSLPPESSKRAMPHFELIIKLTTVNYTELHNVASGL